MSERFFRIKKESVTHKKILNCINENEKLGKFMKKFLKEHGIETDEFYLTDERLTIEPTENDIVKFRAFMMANGKKFKKTSRENKDFKAGLKENNIDMRAARGLNLWDYGCRIYGGASYKEFFDSTTGHFYLHILLKKEETYNITEDAEEIKGSEFYKALENRNMQVTNQ